MILSVTKMDNTLIHQEAKANKDFVSLLILNTGVKHCVCTVLITVTTSQQQKNNNNAKC